MSLLQLTGIRKGFAGVQALKGVSFDVRPGEIHALLGENGAGKSTLIKTMAGVHQPDEGEIVFDGQPVQFSGPRDAQKLGINTIYQELSLYPELSVAENIFVGHAPRRKVGLFRVLDWDLMARRSRELLAELGVHDLDVSRPVGTLSVGNRFLRATVPARTSFAIEDAVRFSWNPDKVVLFDQASGRNLHYA